MSSHSLLSDSSSGAVSLGPRDGLNISQSHWVQEEVPVAGMSYGSASTIDVLTDDILLNIFHFCRNRTFPDSDPPWGYEWDWVSLVHACRRWRQIVFASPRHLYIQLQCTPRTPVRSHLSCWPPLPIIINYGSKRLLPNDEDNVIAALEHPDRVSSIRLSIKRSQLGKIATVMQEPFPALRYITLISNRDTQVLPDGFLGGSAPCLRRLCLGGIPFPALPTLLSSASHLVELELYDIPKAGYISPEAMVGGLAALTRLHTLFIIFRSMTSRRPGPLPLTRTVLPALINFEFQGVSTYLEDLVTRVDCPRIKWFKIFYLKPRVGFRGVRLLEFINRLETPRLREFGWLDIGFATSGDICLEFSNPHYRHDVMLCISFLGEEWRLSHVVQVLDQFSAPLSNVRHLSIGYYRPAPEISHNEWLQLLRPFTDVQTLDVVRVWHKCDPPALEDESGEMASEAEAAVLPALGLIYLECREMGFLKFFENIVADRQSSSRPVTVAGSERDFRERLESYQRKDIDPYWWEKVYDGAE